MSKSFILCHREVREIERLKEEGNRLIEEENERIRRENAEQRKRGGATVVNISFLSFSTNTFIFHGRQLSRKVFIEIFHVVLTYKLYYYYHNNNC